MPPFEALRQVLLRRENALPGLNWAWLGECAMVLPFADSINEPARRDCLPEGPAAHASRDMDGWKGIHPLALITAPGLVVRCSYLSTLRDIGVRDRFRA